MDKNNVPELKRQLADWIRHIMDRKGWTPTHLARQCKLAPSTVIRLLGSRPEYLVGDRTAFAFYMPDDSLGPWFPAGIEMYASGRRAPRPGCDIVFAIAHDQTARVGLVRGIDRDGLRIEDVEGHQEQIPFAGLAGIAVVVGCRLA